MSRVSLEEQETHLCYSLSDRRTSGTATLTTFEKTLVKKAKNVGGKVLYQGKTQPTYWIVEVPVSEIRIAFKSKARAEAGRARRAVANGA